MSTPEPKTLAVELVPGDFEAEGAAIRAYLESGMGRGILNTDVKREAFWRLVSAPYNVTTVEGLCQRIGVILYALSVDESDLITWAFESTLKSCTDGPIEEVRS